MKQIAVKQYFFICSHLSEGVKICHLYHLALSVTKANQKQVNSKIVILWLRHFFFYLTIQVSNKVVDETNK